jgi:tetratricopeptide (TPR) repeat protein
VKYNTANQAYRNKAFLQLGNIAYDEHQYKLASSYYDSLQLEDPSIKEEAALISARKNTLTNIVALVNIIEKEDSLQRIAAMQPAERDAFIKKLLKKYRKEIGLKEEDNSSGGAMLTGFSNKSNEPVDLFASPSKGEWYFYNNSMKSKGFSDFKSKWGKRDNKDNWRRKSAGAIQAGLNLNGNIDIDAPPDSTLGKDPGQSKPVEFTYQAFMEDLPLTPEKIDSSNSNIARSLLSLARLFQNDLEDYQEAINTYENYLQRFPERLENGDVYLGLYFCYNKQGNTAKADYYKNLLATKFAGSNAEKMLSNPAALKPNEKNPEVTRRYEAIYDMFIEGKFAEATEAKKRADSIHGNNYWTPQLLYIEAVNYIKLKNDSIAVVVLNNIISLYPLSPLKEKAVNLIEVLKRRSEIETYLTNLQVTRAEEDKILISENNQVVIQKAAPVVKPEIKQLAPVNKPLMQNDSIRALPGMVSGSFKWEPDKPHFVIMILQKVDAVYVNEAKNAFARYNREKFSNKPVIINKDVLDGERALLVFEPFPTPEEALLYYEKIKKAAPSEISWLQANKYSFMLISANNLQLLKTNKDMNSYKTLLNNLYPGKF